MTPNLVARAQDKRHIGFLFQQEAPPHRIAPLILEVFGSEFARKLSVALLDADIAAARAQPEQLRQEGGL
jgi:hypothetical protein